MPNDGHWRAGRALEGRRAGQLSLRIPQLSKGLCALGMSDGPLCFLQREKLYHWPFSRSASGQEKRKDRA